MGLFSSKQSGVRFGALIDIGSGSVLVAIIASDINKKHPDIIWSKREYTPIRRINSINDSAKSVITSLMNALMALDSEGRSAFNDKFHGKKISEVQVTIAAPWSYTVTKTISYEDEDEFDVSETLIEELLRTAKQKVEEEMEENEKAHDLGLDVITRTTLKVIANGYPIKIGGKHLAHSVKVVQASAVAQEYLVDAIIDAKDKTFPSSHLKQYSFMLPYFLVMADLMRPVSEFCLVDITYEATEIGIVRDGILTYTTHTPFGAFSLAREISETLNIPLEEAYGYLTCEDLSCFVGIQSNEQKAEIENIINAYQIKLTDLFKETGDTLAIPKKIYIHGNLATEPFFNAHILKAAANATKMQHAVYNVTIELLNQRQKDGLEEVQKYAHDTALLISAQFFHTKHRLGEFEH